MQPGVGPDVDVAIVGDGPAALALASACGRAGLHVVVVGGGRPWSATYGTWRDDVPDLPDDAFAAVVAQITVWGGRRHVLDRAYGTIDNDRLRALLGDGVEQRQGWVTGVQHFAWGSRLVAADAGVDARLVVDAGGWPPLSAPVPAARVQPAWQTAFGVFIAEPADRFDGPMLMDLRAPDATGSGATFAYVVPVAAGWLIEETVLAARPAVEPEALCAPLSARCGGWPADAPVEMVRIPMGVAPARSTPPVVTFGAAAGYIHPATGYSLAASLRAAPRVAAAIAGSIARARGGSALMDDAWKAVWPTPQRRSRALHRIGLEALLALDADETRAFFDVFFDLPIDRWKEYLRVDADPQAVLGAMRDVFAAAPANIRRRLLTAVPRSMLGGLTRSRR